MGRKRTPTYVERNQAPAELSKRRTADTLQMILAASQIALVVIGALYTIETGKMRSSMQEQLDFMREQSRMAAQPAIVPTITKYAAEVQRSPGRENHVIEPCTLAEIEAEIYNASRNNAHALRVVFFDKPNRVYLVSPRMEAVVPPGRSPGWTCGSRCLSGPDMMGELTYSYRVAPDFFARHLQDEGMSFVAAAFWDDSQDLWLVRQTFKVNDKGEVEYVAAPNMPSYMAVRYAVGSVK